MIDGIESTASTPAAAGSAWQIVFTWIGRIAVVGGGLMLGAIVGLIVALFTGIIEFSC